MALDEALSRSATERQRRIDARFKLSTGDDTLATLAATLRAAAAGAVGVPEPNLELLGRIFETRPDLRDVVAALRDDNLLSDGIRAARDQVLQNGSMFAFQGYENTNEKEDMRVLETIHNALLRTPPDPRPACRDAARPWSARRRLLEVPLLSLLLTNLRKMRMETHLLMPRR